jgi:hypothetical protein
LRSGIYIHNSPDLWVGLEPNKHPLRSLIGQSAGLLDINSISQGFFGKNKQSALR